MAAPALEPCAGERLYYRDITDKEAAAGEEASAAPGAARGGTRENSAAPPTVAQAPAE